MKIFGFVVAAAVLVTPTAARAEVAQCKALTFKAVTVEGARDDGHFFANKLIVTLSAACGGKTYMHLDMTDPSYLPTLHLALAVKASGKPANVAVNTSKATPLSNQIAYIEFE